MAGVVFPEQETFLDGTGAEGPGIFASLPAGPSREGQRIGVYTVLRQIGSGGMAAVFLAERVDLGKRVAIKFLHVGLGSPEAAGRFLLERRLLATLNHANVASLLDAGVTKDGEPYLVMEYIDGETITECCHNRALDLRARLALFVTVCEAVQFAHEHLIVHRDLKPSNILVGRDGVVKLLDFGIAKVLERAADEELTRTALPPMTPDYAAPEQVRARPVTTATDVYALGMLLYELLADERPYTLRGLSAAEESSASCATSIRRARPARGVSRQRPPHATRRTRRAPGASCRAISTSSARKPSRRIRRAGIRPSVHCRTMWSGT